MANENDWEDIRGRRGSLFHAGMGVLRLTLLFGSGALALALILTPIADQKTRTVSAGSAPLGLDPLSTGSLARPLPRDAYTIRRSILQKNPSAACIIADTGAPHGDC